MTTIDRDTLERCGEPLFTLNTFCEIKMMPILNDAGSDDDASAAPTTSGGGGRSTLARWRWRELNREVLELQEELRLAASARPALVPLVGLQQKQILFELVAEMLARAVATASADFADSRKNASPRLSATVDGIN